MKKKKIIKNEYLHKYFNIKKSGKKGILEFDLNDYDSKISFENAIKADDLASKIYFFHDNVTRHFTKHDCLPGWDKKLTDSQRLVLEHFCKLALDYMNEEK